MCSMYVDLLGFSPHKNGISTYSYPLPIDYINNLYSEKIKYLSMDFYVILE